MTLRKHVTKWMVEFLRKFENYGIKIARVNSILITKSINLLKFCTALGSVVIELIGIFLA